MIQFLTRYHPVGLLRPYTVSTTAFNDQKPGTSGLRKKTAKFMGENNYYLHNFVQATFTALSQLGTDVTSGALLIGGDGRYFNNAAIQIIVKIALGNGVRRILIGQNGLLSTPAVSAIVRERGPLWRKCFGAFILTASHNPGGPTEDFGIKYNCENGGPAPEKLTNMIYDITKTITNFQTCTEFPDVSVQDIRSDVYTSADASRSIVIDVVSSVSQHIELLKTVFDFNAISRLFQRTDFSFCYDCMHGVQGPYATELFLNQLKANPGCLINAVPKEDFNGHHADPNLTYARDVCDRLGVDRTGASCPSILGEENIPCMGAAADGDADRNMILGKHFFVTPSDSLAILAAHADVIPYFRLQGKLISRIICLYSVYSDCYGIHCIPFYLLHTQFLVLFTCRSTPYTDRTFHRSYPFTYLSDVPYTLFPILQADSSQWRVLCPPPVPLISWPNA